MPHSSETSVETHKVKKIAPTNVGDMSRDQAQTPEEKHKTKMMSKIGVQQIIF